MTVEDVKEKMADGLEDVRDRFSLAGSLRGWAIALGVYLFIAMVIGIYWSRQPDAFEPGGLPLVRADVVGSATASTLIEVTSTLLDKPGGFLTNDVFPPGNLVGQHSQLGIWRTHSSA